jgi:hypothetical protein
MQQKPEDSVGLRHLQSPFAKIIAARFYDGPTEGFLDHRDWPHACVFQMVDWDRQSDIRVYEISRVEDLAFDDVVELLFRERRPTWPVWVLPSNARLRGEQLVDECLKRARPLATVSTRDLLGEITRWEVADDAPLSSTLLTIAQRHSP